MKQKYLTVLFGLLLACMLSTGARAMENDMLKVGLKFGADAMFSANLQNYNDTVAGAGYDFGYFDYSRNFVPLGPTTDEYKISVTVDDSFYASGNAYYAGNGGVGGWHLQLRRFFESYDEAMNAAARYDEAFVAYLTDGYTVRLGQYYSKGEAENALQTWDGEEVEVAAPSVTGVVVTVTGSNQVLFYFDCGGLRSLGVQPRSIAGEKTVTWFRGCRYYGGFEYPRVTGGNISVLNVVNIEDYVKGCIGWEIGNDKPLEAIKAQAVCARTYAAVQTRHRSQGFDVCSTSDCQTYQGLATANELTDRAVDETEGKYLYYDGKPVEALYHSSNGGATEDVENVWYNPVGYLKGKQDPYEAAIASRIPNYNWSVSFTAAELAQKLSARNINIGTIRNVFVSELTANGNVRALTFVGSNGSHTVYREQCRTILGLRSMRFRAGESAGSSFFVNDGGGVISGLSGVFAISGDGTVSPFREPEAYVITSKGTAKLEQESQTTSNTSGSFTFSGSGWGHNIGMSQWGAAAMAEQGFDYREILEFYYTGVTIQ